MESHALLLRAVVVGWVAITGPFIVGGIVVIGVVGYFVFVWWKKKIAREQEEAARKQEAQDAVNNYIKKKESVFMSKYEKDLELKARKGGLKLTVDEEEAIAHCRAGERKAVMKALDDESNTCTIDTCDAFGRTLLMIAAEIGDTRIVDGLIRRGVDINARNKFNGATALHFAYQYHHESLGMSLIARGADDSVRAIDGRTCYQLHEDADGDIEQGRAPAPPPVTSAPKNKKSKKGTQKPSQKPSQAGSRRGSQQYNPFHQTHEPTSAGVPSMQGGASDQIPGQMPSQMPSNYNKYAY